MFFPAAAVTCPELLNPANGRVSVTGLTFGSIANYTCDSGFTLSGDAQRSCTAGGFWSGSAPVCNREFK